MVRRDIYSDQLSDALRRGYLQPSALEHVIVDSTHQADLHDMNRTVTRDLTDLHCPMRDNMVLLERFASLPFFLPVSNPASTCPRCATACSSSRTARRFGFQRTV